MLTISNSVQVSGHEFMDSELVKHYAKFSRLRAEDEEVVKHLQNWARMKPWQYFFTGTFKTEHQPHTALTLAKQYMDKCQYKEVRQNGESISYLIFVEGDRPTGRNFLCDENWNRHQGKRIMRIKPRSHIHAILHFGKDPDIKKEKQDPHYLYSDWFDLHGRVSITRIPEVNDCVRYITKYASKSLKSDLWDVSMDSFPTEVLDDEPF